MSGLTAVLHNHVTILQSAVRASYPKVYLVLLIITCSGLSIISISINMASGVRCSLLIYPVNKVMRRAFCLHGHGRYITLSKFVLGFRYSPDYYDYNILVI